MLILDESADGLDPRARIELRELLSPATSSRSWRRSATAALSSSRDVRKI